MAQPIVRLALFLVSICLFASCPTALDMRTEFGLGRGIALCNLVFSLLAAGLVSQLLPNADIARA